MLRHVALLGQITDPSDPGKLALGVLSGAWPIGGAAWSLAWASTPFAVAANRLEHSPTALAAEPSIGPTVQLHPQGPLQINAILDICTTHNCNSILKAPGTRTD